MVTQIIKNMYSVHNMVDLCNVQLQEPTQTFLNSLRLHRVGNKSIYFSRDLPVIIKAAARASTHESLQGFP